MPYQKRTLRQMPPKTRELARIIGELEMAVRKLKNRLAIVEDLEIDSRALANHTCQKKSDEEVL